MGGIDIAIRFFQEGGLFMYPIVVVFAIGVAIALERALYLQGARRKNGQLWKKLTPLLSEGRYTEAGRLLAESKATIGPVLYSGLRNAALEKPRAEVEAAMEEGLMDIVPKMEKRTPYLATFANVATLLGLLGTIIGLIQAFTAVSNADPAQKADLLSSSISVAMNTTAFGLMVAIPLLLIYTVLQAKTNETVDGLESMAVKVLNTVSSRRA